MASISLPVSNWATAESSWARRPIFCSWKTPTATTWADKRTVLKNWFRLARSPRTPERFHLGPDGWLYLTHGVFTHSNVKDPNNPSVTGVTVDAAVARYHPRAKKFEVFADGTSNPWGSISTAPATLSSVPA